MIIEAYNGINYEIPNCPICGSEPDYANCGSDGQVIHCPKCHNEGYGMCVDEDHIDTAVIAWIELVKQHEVKS